MRPVPDQTRAHCYRCDRPERLCLCDAVEPLPNGVRVHVLQHRAERRNALGTVRLLRVGLDAVDVHVLDPHGRSAAVPPVPLPPGAGLLYPSDDAQDLDALPPAARPSDLVVLDGTWSHAHRLHRDNDWIQALPHYKLSPTAGSRYRIRAEPRHECLSTVEAVVAALRVLEPSLEGTERLLHAFDRMIDAQIAVEASHVASPRRVRRHARPSRAVPAALRRAPEDVLVVVAEAAPDARTWGSPFEAARLVAMTLDGARVFDGLMTSTTAPDDTTLRQYGLDAQAWANAAPPSEVWARFAAFCARDQPVTLVTWGPWTGRFLQRRMPEAAHVALKAVWANLCKATVSSVSSVLTEQGLDATPVPLPGRAGARVGQIHALARHIVASATDR